MSVSSTSERATRSIHDPDPTNRRTGRAEARRSRFATPYDSVLKRERDLAMFDIG